ncbi:hypothetical protein JCGZ_10849 [Jatropha curcas]|uniref:Uncharacterized protein n=1 Tax=Jatropha curcas TaxID=180498 RepID=A0A067KGU1_JATCU|nr:hypothetical protein JCGZ_10849 [Jatropha curcas]
MSGTPMNDQLDLIKEQFAATLKRQEDAFKAILDEVAAVITRALKLDVVRPDRRPFEKFTESMPIWYLKHPENYEDRGTGPGIFFGGTELPKKPLERKTSEWTGHGGTVAPALHGGSARRPRR